MLFYKKFTKEQEFVSITKYFMFLNIENHVHVANMLVFLMVWSAIITRLRIF